MAVEKLSDGIRKFAADAVKLECMIKVHRDHGHGGMPLHHITWLYLLSKYNDLYLLFLACPTGESSSCEERPVMEEGGIWFHPSV